MGHLLWPCGQGRKLKLARVTYVTTHSAPQPGRRALLRDELVAAAGDNERCDQILFWSRCCCTRVFATCPRLKNCDVAMIQHISLRISAERSLQPVTGRLLLSPQAKTSKPRLAVLDQRTPFTRCRPLSGKHRPVTSTQKAQRAKIKACHCLQQRSGSAPVAK